MNFDWIDTAFQFGLGVGTAGIGGSVLLVAGAYVLDLIELRRKRTRKPLPEKRRLKVSPIEDMAQWKHQRRIDEATEWQTAFDALTTPSRSGTVVTVHRLYEKSDLRMLTDNYGHKRGRAIYRAGWDLRHHSTCPYECDCPQRVRTDLYHRHGLNV